MADPNFHNRTLYHGDNLNFLRGMNSETVDLVATDPPFKKGRDFHATPDSLAAGAKFEDRWSWEKDVHPDWIDAIEEDWPSVSWTIEAARQTYGADMAAFLCWLGVRVMEMHRILKPTGSMYLHIDHTAHAYVKAIMDGIFGKENFRNELVWRRATSHNDAKQFGRIHDNVLLYGKTSNGCWNGDAIATSKSAEEIKAAFPMNDKRGPVRSENLTGPRHNTQRGSPSTLPWKDYDVFARNRVWSVPKTGRYAKYIEENFIPGYRSIVEIHDRLDALDEAGLIHHPTKGVWPGLKRYADADLGHLPQDIILEPIGFTNYTKGQGESTGFPTQKPLGLYEKFIAASSNPGDTVLDPFCGCATTPVAAERLGRQWVGMDIWDGAIGQVRQRMEDNRQLLADPDPRIHYSTEPPQRTDSGQAAAPDLVLKLQIPEPPAPRMTRAEMKSFLVNNEGIVCKGCLRKFDDPRYLDLDHNVPRSDGGIHHISNRMLLCGPCNRAKSNTLTLTGLRRLNKQNGWMAKN